MATGGDLASLPLKIDRGDFLKFSRLLSGKFASIDRDWSARLEMMTYTAWGSSGVASALVEGVGPPVFADGSRDLDCPGLIWTIEAADFHDACRQYHELQGWEPYKAMEEECQP